MTTEMDLVPCELAIEMHMKAEGEMTHRDDRNQSRAGLEGKMEMERWIEENARHSILANVCPLPLERILEGPEVFVKK